MQRETVKQISPNARTYAFIDASNIIYGATASGWKMDFARLSHYLRDRYGVSEISFYAGLNTRKPEQIKFYAKLAELGYNVRLVQFKKFEDGSSKADVDS